MRELDQDPLQYTPYECKIPKNAPGEFNEGTFGHKQVSRRASSFSSGDHEFQCYRCCFAGIEVEQCTDCMCRSGHMCGLHWLFANVYTLNFANH